MGTAIEEHFVRNISFALTTKQFLDRSKTVTRRLGWLNVKEGDLLCGVLKGMGLKKGEKPTRLGIVRVKSVERDHLDSISPNDCRLEGFPELQPHQFVGMFCRSHANCRPDSIVTRIEFQHIPGGLFSQEMG